jgi:ribosome-associated protein
MPKPPRKNPAHRPPRSAPDNIDKRASGHKRASGTRGKSARKSLEGPSAKRKKSDPPLATVVTAALDDLKGQEITLLDVRHLTNVTDTMVVVSGRSDRHVRALADSVVEKCKAAGFRPIGVEGQESGEWVLVDLGDVVVHVMLPRARGFYNLEKLWDMSDREQAADLGT